MKNKATHFLNGTFVTEEELLISVRDLGFSRGYAVFDFLITYNKKPFKLEEHIDRLFNSANLIKLEIPWSKDQIIKWVHQALLRNDDGSEKSIKIIVSGGISDTLLPSAKSTLAILVDHRHLFPPDFYTKGIGVITVKFIRYSPHAKTNNYIEAVKQAQLAKKVGAVEPIYYNDNQVFEGSTSNIFASVDGKLKTPRSNILSGITRETLLDILDLDLPVVTEDFNLKQLLTAKEVFMTSSNREITPVTKIDGKPIGDGKVGKLTKEVMKQFKEYTSKW